MKKIEDISSNKKLLCGERKLLRQLGRLIISVANFYPVKRYVAPELFINDYLRY